VPLYPQTDVVEVPGFQLRRARDLWLAPDGTLGRGTLEYEGAGDLRYAFHHYLELMAGQGWSVTLKQVDGEKALGVLNKNRRETTVEFARTSGMIQAVIRVAGPEPVKR
jgi:hypothetical protein